MTLDAREKPLGGRARFRKRGDRRLRQALEKLSRASLGDLGATPEDRFEGAVDEELLDLREDDVAVEAEFDGFHFVLHAQRDAAQVVFRRPGRRQAATIDHVEKVWVVAVDIDLVALPFALETDCMVALATLEGQESDGMAAGLDVFS